MNRSEFATVIAYLEFGCGKKLMPRESLDVYFDLMQDISKEVFEIAAKRVLLAHPWPNFPSIAELREAAALTQRGEISSLSAGEAWRLGWNAVKNMDPEVERSVERALAKVPPTVAAALRSMGIQSLCYGKEPISVIRGQFLKVYAELRDAYERQELFPIATRNAIAAAPVKPLKTLPQKNATAMLAGIRSGIGDEPTTEPFPGPGPNS